MQRGEGAAGRVVCGGRGASGSPPDPHPPGHCPPDACNGQGPGRARHRPPRPRATPHGRRRHSAPCPRKCAPCSPRVGGGCQTPPPFAGDAELLSRDSTCGQGDSGPPGTPPLPQGLGTGTAHNGCGGGQGLQVIGHNQRCAASRAASENGPNGPSCAGVRTARLADVSRERNPPNSLSTAPGGGGRCHAGRVRVPVGPCGCRRWTAEMHSPRPLGPRTKREGVGGGLGRPGAFRVMGGEGGPRCSAPAGARCPRTATLIGWGSGGRWGGVSHGPWTPGADRTPPPHPPT